MERARTSGRRLPLIVAALALLVSVLATAPDTPAGAVPVFEAHGSVEQVATTGHVPGAAIELLDGSGAVVATGAADAQGSHLFRHVPVGVGYAVRSAGESIGSLVVTGPTDHPDQAFYDGQTLTEGYQYLTTRDGTQLSVNIVFPPTLPGETHEQPWPVVIDYSGYDPSNPDAPPEHAILWPLEGYVLVAVNMRGTGCSGGAYDYFETLQGLDGYDVVETVAAQDWSTGDVGLIGISFSGISQLFVAQHQPPHLRAINPLSVIGDTFRSTMFPGGIRNRGFALGWAQERVDAAKPAARPWARQRIANGDTTCAANQALRLQARDLVDELPPGRFAEPIEEADSLAPERFVDRINVPALVVGAWQDEQTGGHFPTMLDDFTGSPQARAILTNGTHVEGLAPQNLVHIVEFMDLYVAKRPPGVAPFVRSNASLLYQEVFGQALTLPPDNFSGMTWAEAKAAYESQPPILVEWENGAGGAPGAPVASAAQRFAGWPIPGATTRSWFLAPDGELLDEPPAIPAGEPRGISDYRYDPTAKSGPTYGGSTSDIWRQPISFDWRPLQEGTAASFVTEPLAESVAIAGSGVAELWLGSTAVDTDVEVMLTEVRPDGQERAIQSGWLRASRRVEDPARTSLMRPVQTHRSADAANLPADELVLARVELFPVAHVLRPGSRLRMNIEVPGGNQPFWDFDVLPGEPGQIDRIGHSTAMVSALRLPTLATADQPALPAALPACPSLRNQPCRDYVPDRVPTDVVAEVVDVAPAAQVAGGSAEAVTAPDTEIAVTWTPPTTDGQPDGYHIVVAPTGEQFDVPGDVTTFSYPTPEQDVAYSFTVTAIYGAEAAPASSASLSVTIASPTPVDPPVDPGTPAPAPDPGPGAVDQPADGAVPVAGPTTSTAEATAGATTGRTTGTLPVTGAVGLPLAALGASLLLFGESLRRWFGRKGTRGSPGTTR